MGTHGVLEYGLKHEPPRPVTSFVGRSTERLAVLRSFQDAQVVTLVGPGGCGKTRLALEVARDLQTAFAHDVCFLAIRMLRDPAMVMQAVASAIGVREPPGRMLPELLDDFVRTNPMTLLLDGCEYAVEHLGPLVDRLIRVGPGVRVLATSRRALGVKGEAVIAVSSLPVPGPSSGTDDLAPTDAVRLFIDRTRIAKGEFRPTPESADWVRRICRRLDGVPLAIELAAAQGAVSAIDEVAAGLERIGRSAVDEHSCGSLTLSDVIGWSCGQLAPPARRLLCRLSVFPDSCTLDAAQAICGGDGIETHRVADLLAALVRHALVQLVTPTTSPVRYSLLDTVRDYAAEVLAHDGSGASVRARYRQYYLQLADRAAVNLLGEDQIEWFNLLEAEHTNLLGALEWGCDHPEASADCVRLAGSLWWFWYTRGYLSEGRRCLEAAAARASADTPGVAFALGAAASIASHQRDYAGADRLARQAEALGHAHNDARALFLIHTIQAKILRERGDLAEAMDVIHRGQLLAHETGDTWMAALALLGRGNVLLLLRREAEALARFKESLDLFLSLGDRWGIAHNLYRMASTSVTFGEHGRAAVQLRESIALFRMLGDRSGAAYALLDLAKVALALRQTDVATVVLVEGLVEFNGLGDAQGTAEALDALAHVQATAGNYARAAYLLGAAAAIRDKIGAALPPSRRAANEQVFAELCGRGGVDACEAAWAAGSRVAVADTVEMVLGWDETGSVVQ